MSMYLEGADQSAYFITFRTYGTWLHGDSRGSVDWTRNKPGTPLIEPNIHFERLRRDGLGGEPFVLNDRQRDECEAAIHALAAKKSWSLMAVNVRTNHIPLRSMRGSKRRMQPLAYADGGERAVLIPGSFLCSS